MATGSVMVRARETAPAMAVIGRMKFPAFAAEMFVKAANREARRLHHGGDAGPIQALRPKSTSSVLQDSLVSSRLVLLFVSHISIGLYT